MANEFDDDESQSASPGSSEFARMLEESFQKKPTRLQPGTKIRGQVLVVGKEDVFVAIGGTQREGVVRRRDLTAEDGSLTLQVGDSLDLYVTGVKGGEVFLSPKATAANLSEDLEEAYSSGMPVEGKVTEVCNGGVRVQVLGKSAFCPISQLDTKRVETGEEFVGRKLEFRITQISEGGRNIVVSRRKLLEAQRGLGEEAFVRERKVGDLLEGTVTRIEPFGAFVEVAPGIEGLVHISELAWSRIGHPAEVVSVGQAVQAKLLETARKEGRLKISLSIKQTSSQPDTWAQVAQKFPVGTRVTGKIERKEAFGLFVRLDAGLTGLLPKSRGQDRPEFSFEKARVGDSLEVQVAELRLEERRISLDFPKEAGSDDWKSHVTSGTAGGGFSTLGDQLKKALEGKGAAPASKKKG